MKSEIKELWCNALESENYTQGFGRLRRGDKFCCLGVLCDLYVKNGENGKWDIFNFLVHNSTKQDTFLTSPVLKWVELNEFDPTVIEYDGYNTTLSKLNDRRIPFKEISKIIREQL